MQEDDLPSLDFLKHPVVWAVTLIRFLAALYILINPLWGLIWSFVFDILDAQVLIHYLGIKRSEYHLWDKNVDWFAYITEFLVAIQYGLYLPFFLLLFWRFAGQFMFMRTEKTIYFILFPNFFEIAFLWLVLFHPAVTPFDFTELHPWSWLVALLVGKVIHEVLLHFLWSKILIHQFAPAISWWQRFLRGQRT